MHAFVTNAVAIAAGASHCLALTANGTVIGWGANNYGQATGVSTYPDNVITNDWVSIDGALLSNVVAIAAGDQHSLALRSDGTVLAWGYNRYGETNAPAGLSNVVAIGPGGSQSVFHCLVLKNDGTVVAWGLNSWGQTDVPSSLSNVVAVSTGPAFSLALAANAPPVGAVPLTPLKWDSDGFSLSLPSESGRVYTLEYVDSLTDDRWISLPLVAGNGHTLILTDPTATNSQRFYHVRRW